MNFITRTNSTDFSLFIIYLNIWGVLTSHARPGVTFHDPHPGGLISRTKFKKKGKRQMTLLYIVKWNTMYFHL